MAFLDEIKAVHRVKVDRRAGTRGIGNPSEVTILASGKYGDVAGQFDGFIASGTVPAAFVLKNGDVYVLSAGYSGLIVFEGVTEDGPNEAQTGSIDAVAKVLAKFATEKSISVPVKAKKEHEKKEKIVLPPPNKDVRVEVEVEAKVEVETPTEAAIDGMEPTADGD